MPWTYARTWHKALWALYDLGENADLVIVSQTALISQQSEEIMRLRAQLDERAASIHRLSKERHELVRAGDDVAENYRRVWVEQLNNGPTTPPSVAYWSSVKERHSR